MIRDIISNPHFRESASYIRYNPGSRDTAGNWVDGMAMSPVPLDVVTYPPEDAELRDLVDGNARLIAARWFIVQRDDISALRIGPTTQTDSDIIQYEGLDWRVRNVNPYYKFEFAQILGIREAAQSG